MIAKEALGIGDIIYWVKMVPNCDIFQVVPVKVHNIRPAYFTCTDTTSKFTYLYENSAAQGDRLYLSKQEAEDFMNAQMTDYYATHKKKSNIFYDLDFSKEAKDVYE